MPPPHPRSPWCRAKTGPAWPEAEVLSSLSSGLRAADEESNPKFVEEPGS